MLRGFTEAGIGGDASDADIDRPETEVEDDNDNEIEASYMDKWLKEENDDDFDKKEADEKEVIPCQQEKLEGKKHPETGVPFERRTVQVDDRNIEGVFPQFESKYDTILPEELYKESDPKQFKYCTQQLKVEIQKNPKLAEQFNARQYQQIMDEAPRISGYTWHHTEEPGKMQLVDAEIHAKTGHTGGRSIWGGGAESR